MTAHLPSVTGLATRFDAAPSSLVYDSQGQLVARLGNFSPTTPLSAISPYVAQAIIAVEDRNFYRNPGFDVLSILRAAYVDLIHRAPVQGASTITEQLAKTLYLNSRKSLTRKVQEFWLGLELARHYRKTQILDMYLNSVYFGEGAYGIAQASRTYFDTSPQHLTLAQATLLAGLPQAPSLYDPRTHWRLAKQRQVQVVAAMVRLHELTPQQGHRVLEAPVHLQSHVLAKSAAGYPYPWYLDQVVQELLSQGFTMNQILHGGLHIKTALRPKVYNLAQRAVDRWMNTNFGVSASLYPAHQAAAIVENPHNGHIWAIIGGRRHFTFLQDDLAIDARRSSGSAIKPLLDYAPALARGYTQMSVVQDVPIFAQVAGQRWWPRNADGIYRGYLDLRDALALSDNDVAVHLLDRVGLPYALHYLQSHFDMKVPFGQYRGLGLALGVDTDLWSLTRGYAAIDNGGQLVTPVLVTQVTKNGHVLFSAAMHQHSALSPDQAALLTDMMERALDPRPLPGVGPHAYATGYQLGIGRPAAAKSGTNNDEEDAWFLGFEPQMVVGVWEGNRCGEIPQLYTRSGQGPAYGAVAAGPIWKQIMQSVNRQLHLKPQSFSRPPGLVYVKRVSITSGDRPGPYTPRNEIQGAWYIDGTQPTRRDHDWYPVRIVAAHPRTSWRPGCGAFITVTALKRESDWHPGVPRPWDAIFWAPQTARCGSFAKSARPSMSDPSVKRQPY